MKTRYIACMIITLTAKLRLRPAVEQFQALQRTQLAYRDALNDALNYVSRYAFANGKMSNKVGLQEGTYQDIRAHFGLPAQMACSVP
jgi:putative transposase